MAKTYNTIPSVATGDVYTASAHNAIGTTINSMRVPPMCVLTITGLAVTTAVTLGNTTTTGTWTEQVDTDDMHSTSANQTRITVATAGVYAVTASLMGGASNINAYAMIKVNGTQTSQSSIAGNATYFTRGQVTLIHNASVNDYYEYETAAASSLTSDFRFSAVWLGQVS